jgi:hypothetical protein
MVRVLEVSKKRANKNVIANTIGYHAYADLGEASVVGVA